MMSRDQEKRVMEELIDRCRQAYQGKMPLIMVDTERIELMDRLARESRLVDLFVKEEKRFDRGVLNYYAYVGDSPRGLEASSNFTYDPEDLREIAQKGGVMGGVKTPPILAVLHLTKDSWFKKSDAQAGMVACLRNYVHSYVRCWDNASPLRSSCVLLYGDPGLLPEDLAPYTEILTVKYPKRWEIAEIVMDTVSKILQEPYGRTEEERKEARAIAKDMAGFSISEVEDYTKRLLYVDSGGDAPAKDNRERLLFKPEQRQEILLDAKSRAITGSGGLLRLYREDRKKTKKGQKDENDGASGRREDGLGGMKALTDWADKAGDHMLNADDYSLNRGVPAMKGALVCGVPGCGKSEAARILHRRWDLPLLRMDVDALMGGLVGDSERNLRTALAQAEAMAPCILWIDEIDKGFSGAASDSRDGGTFKRMFSHLLTWMSDNTKPCFIYATANDISRLPPEFFRSGRFDVLFSLYLPTSQECMDIFAEQMSRADRRRMDTADDQGLPRKPPLFEKECYSKNVMEQIMELPVKGKDPEHPEGIKFLSGADIEKIVFSALKSVEEPALDKGIGPALWVEALRRTFTSSTISTMGSSSANLDKIAACYVRLMRENFVPAAAEEQCLFRKEQYQRVWKEGRLTVRYNGRCTMGHQYDRALFNALKDRIERIGAKVEFNALNRASE